jgi:HD-like signal output (HDOD) protein
MSRSADSPLIQPPHDLAGWASCFDAQALPVLAETADALDELRDSEDAVDARLLAETVSTDPLLTLKLLAHVGRLQRRRNAEGRGDTETVTAALVMLGIGPFFRHFTAMATVEGALAQHPDALRGFGDVLARGRRAANFALGFAVHRMDPDAPVIHEAALLHDFAELLLWWRAPALAQQIAARQRADPALRSATAQREVLNVELADLQHQLMIDWALPALLVRISDDRHADAAQVRNVLLAVRVARHSAQGWDNPALPDDVTEIADLLHLGCAHTWTLLREIDG